MQTPSAGSRVGEEDFDGSNTALRCPEGERKEECQHRWIYADIALFSVYHQQPHRGVMDQQRGLDTFIPHVRIHHHAPFQALTSLLSTLALSSCRIVNEMKSRSSADNDGTDTKPNLEARSSLVRSSVRRSRACLFIRTEASTNNYPCVWITPYQPAQLRLRIPTPSSVTYWRLEGRFSVTGKTTMWSLAVCRRGCPSSH